MYYMISHVSVYLSINHLLYFFQEEWVICRIFNKSSNTASDHNKKMNQYYPNPNYCSPSSPILPHLQSIESPSLFPLPPSLTDPSPPTRFQYCPPRESILPPLTLQEEVPFSNWLDAYLQNPSFYDVALGAPHDLSSLP